MYRFLVFIFFTSIITTISAQHNFKLSKSLSDNFDENLITFGESDGIVYMYDKIKEQIIAYNVQEDSYISTPEKYYEGTYTKEPNGYSSITNFITKDYVVSCFLTFKEVKGYTETINFLFFDKKDLKFKSKIKQNLKSGPISQYNGDEFYINYLGSTDKVAFSYNTFDEDEKQVFTNIDVIDCGTIKRTQLTKIKFPDIFEEYRSTDIQEIHISELGEVFIFLRNYSTNANFIENPFDDAFFKVNLDGTYKYALLKEDDGHNHLIFNFNTSNNHSYMFTMSNSIDDKDKSQINIYDYYEYDENLDLVTHQSDYFAPNLIKEANQELSFRNLKESSDGLVSFWIKSFSFLDNLPVIILGQSVGLGKGTATPSILVLFMDKKGVLDSYELIKVWNTDAGDLFAQGLSRSPIFYDKDAIYFISNFQLRLDPFPGERSYEEGKFGFCKITADQEISYKDITIFKEMNNYGCPQNLKSFNLIDGNIVCSFRQLKSGNVPEELKKYKYFYGSVKLK